MISSFVSRLLVGGCPGGAICSAAGASKAAIGLVSFCFSSHSLDMTSRPNRFFQGLKLNPIGVSSGAREHGKASTSSFSCAHCTSWFSARTSCLLYPSGKESLRCREICKSREIVPSSPHFQSCFQQVSVKSYRLTAYSEAL